MRRQQNIVVKQDSTVNEALRRVLNGQFVETPWKFVTSESTEVSGQPVPPLVIGGAGGSIWINRDDSGQCATRLHYFGIGFGMGVGALPANVLTSTRDMPSAGKIYRMGSLPDTQNPAEFVSRIKGAVAFMELTADTVVTYSLNFMFLGGNGFRAAISGSEPGPLATLIETATYYVRFGGYGLSAYPFNLSATLYQGFMY